MNNLKAIQLSPTNYIILDDSNILPCKPINICMAHKTKPCNSCKRYQGMKITHSNQPLEIEVIPDEKFPKVFDKIKHIPLSEVEEAINGYSVEKMAEKEYPLNYLTGQFNPNNVERRNIYIKGFKAAQELSKDKLFTIEDMNIE